VGGGSYLSGYPTRLSTTSDRSQREPPQSQ
jgi:hypothetical protein